MEAQERRVLLILADISGYTRFMVANQTAAVHGQGVISKLLETILAEVEIPLTLHAIEGDAVFLSASHPGDEAGWQQVLDTVRRKLMRFFEVFLESLVRIAESTPCGCVACQNVDALKLKIVVHSGTAVFHTVAGHAQISGTDVILAHRLLKNSVPSHEYLLMTEAAWRDLGPGLPGEFVPGQEDCEGIGVVRTMVRLMGDQLEQVREEFYAKPEAEQERIGRGYREWMMPSMGRGLFQQLRHPVRDASLASRIAHAIVFLLQTPLVYLTLDRDVREAMRRRRAERAGRRRADVQAVPAGH